MRLEMGAARPNMLKKIKTTELARQPKYAKKWSHDLRGGETEDTICLGHLGAGLEVTEDGVFVELDVSALSSGEWGSGLITGFAKPEQGGAIQHTSASKELTWPETTLLACWT